MKRIFRRIRAAWRWYWRGPDQGYDPLDWYAGDKFPPEHVLRYMRLTPLERYRVMKAIGYFFSGGRDDLRA